MTESMGLPQIFFYLQRGFFPVAPLLVKRRCKKQVCMRDLCYMLCWPACGCSFQQLAPVGYSSGLRIGSRATANGCLMVHDLSEGLRFRGALWNCADRLVTV